MKTTSSTAFDYFTSALTVEILDVVSFLKSKLKLQALYCFGIRQQSISQLSFIDIGNTVAGQQLHLDLMVIGTQVSPNATADLSDLIYKHTGGRYRVTLIIHKPKQIRAATIKNGYLFHKVLDSGLLMLADPSYSGFKEVPPVTSLCVTQVKKFTANRLYTANKLFTLADAVERGEGGLLKASFLHTGVEQLCLAIIYAYMGYYPNHFHLKYLFSLCRHCTPICDSFFPNTTKEDKKLMHILHTTPSLLRFKKTEQFVHTDLIVLEERCLHFYKAAEKLIKRQIELLSKEEGLRVSGIGSLPAEALAPCLPKAGRKVCGDEFMK